MLHFDSQSGKSLACAPFAVAMKFFILYCIQSGVDMEITGDLVVSLSHAEGLGNTTVQLIIINRDATNFDKWIDASATAAV